MSKNRITIYAGMPIQDFLDRRPLRPDWASRHRPGRDTGADSDDKISESVAMNRLAERYNFMLQQNFPMLSIETWEAILNAFNGRTEIGIDDMRYIPSGVAEDIGFGDRDWQAPKSAWPEHIREASEMTPAECLVAAEVNETFWGGNPARPGGKNGDLRELLASFSGRPVFAVYKDDPIPSECWEIVTDMTSLDDASEMDVVVRHTIHPEIEVVTHVSRKGDQHLAGVRTNLQTLSSHVLHAPNEDLRDTLLRLVMGALPRN